ncbi:glycoside hydrolase family 5 protein [Cellvibrio japonicus]|uniref:Endo-1,4-beta glucanase, putative, cel5H n=1 Tax=Cellvibrio japonicus (strain Ueda107) TaxID=498211 RepID=B3PJL3_CELJU|nr:glycoside hydrolase family 5 protein [Cellvibrio japonicus]ACE83988.1 endo-1,4-beta glucanase, putative, cel5H [Cellvibrio japonicus Ueda107]QEI11297.1 glycoside hydrolase family 5 protein [Cellvibrio japonicus]QEI14871.1 glycoside hydrolase family 5 protein [Cellvibrio japonicus]QEI18451.1 glycoside hydrolase family 5 protein [Cellvibrio japonicus]
MNRPWRLLTGLLGGWLAPACLAVCLSAERLTGVNLAGAEFNSKKLPGVFNKDYTYPTQAELVFSASQGANVIRLPFRWERLQPQANGLLDSAELGRLKTTVEAAYGQGLCVILDVHNYAKYFGQSLGDEPALEEAFINLWLALAREFPDADKTAFGLMNEPAYMPLERWTALAQRTLAALRNAKAPNLVLLGGGGWNGLHSWFNEQDGVSNANSLAGLEDPLKRTIIEVHQYADSNYSGTRQECLAADHFDSRFERIRAWADAQGLQLFLGEFGVAPNSQCLATLTRFLELMDNAQWKGWTYWAAGRWWGSYAFALNTSSTEPSAQWALLRQFFFRPALSPPLPPTRNES